MKKNLFILVFISVFILNSCGPKKPAVIICDCSEIKLKGSDYVRNDSIFTGICTKKDQNDTVLQKTEYKNGFKLSYQAKEKVFNEYVYTADLLFSDRVISDGYEIKISEFESQKGSGKYVSSFAEYKGGKTINEYSIFILYNPKDQKPNYYFSYRINYKDGNNIIDNSKTSYPSCFINPEYETGYYVANRYGGVGAKTGTSSQMGDNWKYSEYELSKIDGILECFKKELPRFSFWFPKN